jgi:hypothetical protein
VLTTRGETYGDETFEAIDGWQLPRDEAGFLPDDELLTVPTTWLAAPGSLGVERSSWWRWRRRAAMLAAISGIALAVVTFSLGSPVSDYTLASADEPTETAEPDAGSSTGASDLDIDLAGNGQAISLFALSAGTAEAFSAESGMAIDGGSLNVNGTVETTTTTEATTTTIGWSEPVIEPEAEWIDAGHGVAVPDVLLRIRFCESTNNYQAAHRSSSARGAYQFLSSSWSWYGHAARYGAASADLATPAQQDEAAVLTLRQDGTRPWKESFTCWGSDSITANYASVRPPTTTTTAPSTTASSAEETTSSTDTSTTSTTVQSSTSTSTTTPSSTTTSSTAPTTTATTTSTTAGGS